MIRIITDSAADFETNELEAMGVTAIPLSVIFGEDEYKENVNLTKDEFYNILTKNPNHPTTSQPTPEDFMNIFKEAKDAGDEILGIFISSKLSGTYQGAMLGMQLCEYDNFHLVDSLSATVGERVLVEYAVKLRDEGRTLFQIASVLEEIKENLHIFAALDTLEYLKKGGRISASAAAIGTLANLKPIIHVGKAGVVETCAKAIGTRKAISTIIKQLETKAPNIEFPIYLLYSFDKSNAEMLADALAKKGYVVKTKNISPVGAVIGTHVGPGAFGLVYVAK
ncbi:MAG: DegV family protein [Clostridia bacterium]|nr:DegV family protein [Clostridia bacterium]